MFGQHSNNHHGPRDQAPARDEGRLIELRGVTKAYTVGDGEFLALKGIDMQVDAGEFVAVVGKSGSGKSTLLNLLSGIDSCTAGQVVVAGTPVHTLSQNQVAVWRGRHVGVVFQFFQLLPTLTVVENVMLPMDFCNTFPVRERQARALRLLEEVGVAQQASKLPALLSGGEQQRVAIARAQANDPPLILADEPTGNLDSHTADAMLQLFKDLATSGKIVVMVTHERDLTQWVGRMVTLADGQIVRDQAGPARLLAGQMQEVAHV
jgi:putative ABC transport system ATP-binding protein